ncbi:hypothetical protein BDFB_014624, partial [Asbolus verrucosus]
GVAVYVRDTFSSKVVFEDFEDITRETHEQILIEVTVDRFRFLVGILYRPPSSKKNNTSVPNFIESIDVFLSCITVRYDKILILGDVNIDHFNVRNPIFQSFAAYDFVQLINDPTRITQTSQKLIDVIYCNFPDMVLNSGTINADLIADHQLVYCTLNIKFNKIQPKFITYRDF